MNHTNFRIGEVLLEKKKPKEDSVEMFEIPSYACTKITLSLLFHPVLTLICTEIRVPSQETVTDDSWVLYGPKNKRFRYIANHGWKFPASAEFKMVSPDSNCILLHKHRGWCPSGVWKFACVFDACPLQDLFNPPEFFKIELVLCRV